MSDKLTRISLTELEAHARRLEERGHTAEANDLLVYQMLISRIRADAERDSLLANLARRFDALEALTATDREKAGLAYRALLSGFEELRRLREIDQRQAAADRARLDTIAAVVDANIDKILEVAKRAEALALDAGDHD